MYGDGISAGAGKLGAFAGAFSFPGFPAVTLGLNRAMPIAAIVAAAEMLLTIAMLPEPTGTSLEQIREQADHETRVRHETRGQRARHRQ